MSSINEWHFNNDFSLVLNSALASDESRREFTDCFHQFEGEGNSSVQSRFKNFVLDLVFSVALGSTTVIDAVSAFKKLKDFSTSQKAKSCLVDSIWFCGIQVGFYLHLLLNSTIVIIELSSCLRLVPILPKETDCEVSFMICTRRKWSKLLCFKTPLN